MMSLLGADYILVKRSQKSFCRCLQNDSHVNLSYRPGSARILTYCKLTKILLWVALRDTFQCSLVRSLVLLFVTTYKSRLKREAVLKYIHETNPEERTSFTAGLNAATTIHINEYASIMYHSSNIIWVQVMHVDESSKSTTPYTNRQAAHPTILCTMLMRGRESDSLRWRSRSAASCSANYSGAHAAPER
eukprot:6176533-Pleurochrysis_carterae.AAC.2